MRIPVTMITKNVFRSWEELEEVTESDFFSGQIASLRLKTRAMKFQSQTKSETLEFGLA